MHRSELDRHRIRGVAAIALFALCGCLRTGSTPDPPPEASLEQHARLAVRDYARRLADSFDEAALQLESGALQTAAEVNLQLQTANSDGRKQAFHPLDEVLNKELGGDRWDPAAARRMFQEISRGLRSLP